MISAGIPVAFSVFRRHRKTAIFVESRQKEAFPFRKAPAIPYLSATGRISREGRRHHPEDGRQDLDRRREPRHVGREYHHRRQKHRPRQKDRRPRQHRARPVGKAPSPNVREWRVPLCAKNTGRVDRQDADARCPPEDPAEPTFSECQAAFFIPGAVPGKVIYTTNYTAYVDPKKPENLR